MEQKQNDSMAHMMAEKMAGTLLDNVDEIAAVLRIDVGNGDAAHKVSRLFAASIMDRMTGRMLEDPGHALKDRIEHAESSGRPMTVLEQDLMAGWAVETMDFWRGSRMQPATDVLWNMLLAGRFPFRNPSARINDVLGVLYDFEPADDPVLIASQGKVDAARKAMWDAVCEACGAPDPGPMAVQALHDYIRDNGVPIGDRADAEKRCMAAADGCLRAYEEYYGTLRKALLDAVNDTDGPDGLVTDARDLDHYASAACPASVRNAREDADSIRKAMARYLK